MESDDRDQANAGSGAPSGKSWGRRVIIGGITAVAAVTAIGFAAAATGDFGPGFGMGRFGMGRHMMHAHMGMGFGEHGMSYVLDQIDATPEQEDTLWAIIDSTHSELRPAFREFRETREAIAGILGAPTIDRAALEKLRSDRIATIDATSRKMTDALVQAAEVLTPEQRAKLLEHFKERRSHGRW
jgi:Spy/CpxP family protein refolding chaperone